MKLLLTSAGIRNQSIAAALEELVGKSPRETKIGFIPTAKNVEYGNADWFINQFIYLRKFGYEWVDIIDPSAAGVDWREALRTVDVVMVGGGNTFHLLDQTRKTGLDDWITESLKSKVYVGISAGSMIVTPSIGIASTGGDVNKCGITNLTGLALVPFEVSPHCDGDTRSASNEQYAQTIRRKLYGIDDETAVKVIDDTITVITEGEWRLYNEENPSHSS